MAALLSGDVLEDVLSATKSLPSRTAKSTISRIKVVTPSGSLVTLPEGAVSCDPRVTLVSALDYLLTGQAFPFKRKLYHISLVTIILQITEWSLSLIFLPSETEI